MQAVYLSNSMKTFRGLAMAALTLNLGCSGQSRSDQPARSGTAAQTRGEQRTQSVTASPLTPISTSAPPANGATASSTPADTCPRTGLWARCSVEKRLSQAGYVVRPLTGDAKRRSGFSIEPIAYMLGPSRLEVFIYPSADAVMRDMQGLDTALAGPRSAPNQWGIGMHPTFVRSANLIAVFLTENPTQSERLTLALTAGAPQP